MNISAVVTAWGSYYKEGSIYVQRAKDLIFEKSDTKVSFPTLPTEDTAVDFATPLFSRTLQAFQKKFTALGALDFVPERLQLAHMKIDVEEYPDELENSALMFMEHKGLDRKATPIVPMIGEMMIMKANEEFELNTIFKGVKATPTDGTASTAGTEMDGIRKKIRGYNTAGISIAVATGAVPSANVDVVAWIETFYWGIAEKYRGFIKEIHVSDQILTKFKRGMAALHDIAYDKLDGKFATIYLTDCKVVGCASMRGSDMIWATVEGNAVGRVKKFANKGAYLVGVKDLRLLQISTDWWAGYGFMYGGFVIHNDRDLS